MSNVDWYARKMAELRGQQAPAPARAPLPTTPINRAALQSSQQSVAPTQPMGAAPESLEEALLRGDQVGGAKTAALARKGICPECGQGGIHDDGRHAVRCYYCGYNSAFGKQGPA